MVNISLSLHGIFLPTQSHLQSITSLNLSNSKYKFACPTCAVNIYVIKHVSS